MHLYDYEEPQAQQIQAKMVSLENALVGCSKSLNLGSDAIRYTSFLISGINVNSEVYISQKLGTQFNWEQKDGFEVLFQLTRQLHNEMRRIYSNSQLAQVRWRSFEDEADEFAVTILRSLGQPESLFVKSIVSFFENREPGLLERCELAIKDKTEVPFGYLGDPHHAPCYRLKNVEENSQNKDFVSRP